MSEWFALILRVFLASLMAGMLTPAEPDIPVMEIPDPADTELIAAMENAQTPEECIILGTELELDSIDLSRFELTVDEVEALYAGLMDTSALPWYLDQTLWSYMKGPDGLVDSLLPIYLDPQEYDRDAYERAVEKALAETVYPGMSELQIALSVHDYLASICAYDDSLTYATEHDVLVRGTAVCQGYAEAYMDLLTRSGMECVIVTSEEMNHAWNQVKIGENWYHVDVTWDDPTPNVEGQVMHHVFLISDETMQTGSYGYYGWDSPNTCTDTTYETDQFWQDSYSRIIYTSADNCYLRRRGERGYQILQRDADGNETQLYRFDYKYTYIGIAGRHRVHYYTAGLTKLGDALCFTDVHQVRRLDLLTGEVTPLYEHDISATGQVLIGSFSDGETLRLTTMDEDQEQYASEVPFPAGP